MTTEQAGSPAPAPAAPLSIAFCPCPPLLLPAVEGRPAEETTALRRACAEAVEALLADGPEAVVVVGPGAEGRYGAGDAGDLRGVGVELEVPFAGGVRPGGRRTPTALTLGAWLLDDAGYGGLRLGVGPADLATALADVPGTVGVLALGDGSARRSVKAPGYLDEAAAPFDAAVAAALAAGDAAALAALDAAEGERLLAAGVPVWRAVGAVVAGRRVEAVLRHDEAPLGVGYLVASLDGAVTGTPPPVVAVVGPTATGKTALAVALARRLGGEVVNADSMQLYRGMDIGTAKPDAAERGGVPHHLLDLWHVRQPASVAEYRDRARAEVDRLRAAGVLPLLVGGSGLYVRAVLDELDFPGTDPAVRARLEAELAEVGAAALHARLADLDPAAAAAVLPSNGRRIVRALEVGELTGAPFRASLPEPRPRYPAVVVGLDRDPADLDERIARRVDRMWAAGFVAEVEALAADGLREGPTASRALGYAQVLDQLDGVLSAEEARERTVLTTRRFVRRQRSWFRRDASTTWLDAARPDLADAAAGVITGRTLGT